MSELKVYVQPLKTNILGQTIVGQSYYLKSEADKVIAELKAKLEDAKATAYTESVDAGMRERRLRRALWLARARGARSFFWYWCARFAVERGFTMSDIFKYQNTTRKSRMITEWMRIWQNVDRKCLAMAEKFKEEK